MTSAFPFSDLLKSPAQNPLQEKARQEYLRTGLPTTKNENWRYTNLRDLTKITFSRPSVSAKVPAVSGLMVVNGIYRPELSDVPEGVVVKRENNERIDTLIPSTLSPLGTLNTALFQDVLTLHIPKDTTLKIPIEINFLTATDDQPIAAFPRMMIVAEENAQATIIEHYTGQGTQPYFANTVAGVIAHKNSRLQHYMIQQESPAGFHISTAMVRLEEGATCDSFILHAGGKLARREVHATLNGSHADYRLSGAYLAKGEQLADITTFINHAQPQCQSREIVKGVIDDHARAVFYGKIHVAPDAQKTDGYQLNKALLLSDSAEINSRPELEIHADDVKCSHGATVGELDDQALFYLRARGIDETTARQLLISAFLEEVVNEIQNTDVRTRVRNIIAGQLGSIVSAETAVPPSVL